MERPVVHAQRGKSERDRRQTGKSARAASAFESFSPRPRTREESGRCEPRPQGPIIFRSGILRQREAGRRARNLLGIRGVEERNPTSVLTPLLFRAGNKIFQSRLSTRLCQMHHSTSRQPFANPSPVLSNHSTRILVPEGLSL